MIAVSALAASALHGGRAAAQIAVTCSQPFYMGQNQACGTGTMQVSPNGGISTSGCIARGIDADPGRCIVTNSGPAPTRNVVVDFPVAAYTASGGGDNVTVNNLRLQAVGATVVAPQLTFTPTEITNTVTVNVGGTINFTQGQAFGSYNGAITVRAQLQ